MNVRTEFLCIFQTYNRIRTNRHSRLRLKTKRKREESGGTGSSHMACPVCRIPLQGSPEQLSNHVESCLRKVRTVNDIKYW